jgi:hypothetical protein
VFTGSRSTDVPTQAQSGHQSLYSYNLACTTIDASITGSDLVSTWYYMTGPDFSPLHKKEFTLSFWVKATVTGINCVSFANNAANRWYCAEYTINASNTWEKKTITITGDTGGTWLFDEASVGIHIVFSYLAGSSRHATGGVWSGTVAYATSNQVNNASSTSNIFRMSQLQLVLGATSPTFLGEPITTVRSQIAYYFQTSYQYVNGQYPGQAHMNGMVGILSTSTTMNTGWYCIQSVSFYPMMRSTPTFTTYDRVGASGKVTRYSGNSGGHANGINPAVDSQGATGVRVYLGVGGSPASYPIYGFHLGYKADARH